MSCLYCLSCMWKCDHVCRQAFGTWMLFGDRLLTVFSAAVCIFPSSGSSAHCVGLGRWFEAVAFVGVAWWCPFACHVNNFNLDHRNGPWMCLLHKPDTSAPSLGHTVWENPSSTSSSVTLLCTPWHAVFAFVYAWAWAHTLIVMIIKIHFYKLKNIINLSNMVSAYAENWINMRNDPPRFFWYILLSWFVWHSICDCVFGLECVIGKQRQNHNIEIKIEHGSQSVLSWFLWCFWVLYKMLGEGGRQLAIIKGEERSAEGLSDIWG